MSRAGSGIGYNCLQVRAVNTQNMTVLRHNNKAAEDDNFQIGFSKMNENECCGGEGLLLEVRVYQRRLVGKRDDGMYG
jgi:hypothetical protein